LAIRWRAIFLAFVAAALGCARTIDDREGVERKYGPPEEESTYYVGDEAYSIWWYWSIGRAFGFRYKKARATCGGEEGWDRSFTFTFQPVATPEEKRVVIEQLKLFLALTTPVSEERVVDLTPWIERAKGKKAEDGKGSGPSP